MNRLYDRAGQGYLEQAFKWTTDDVRVALVADAYVFDPTHGFGIDLGSHIIGIPLTIPGPVADSEGKADGGSVLFTALSDVRTAAYVVLIKWNTTINDSELLAFYDNIAGMPFVPSGGNYAIFPDAVLGGYYQIGGDSC